MMLFSPLPTEDPPEFTFFNTIVPQDHPSNVRRLRFPQRFRQCTPVVTVDVELPLGALHRDGPFIADPTQALLVVCLPGGTLNHVFAIFRTQTLVAHTCSTDGNTCIPWDELWRDAMIMELPVTHSPLLIQGVHATAQKTRAVPDDANHFCLRTFDFSRRGSSLLCGKIAGAERVASCESGQDILFEGCESVDDWVLRSLGNGTFYSLDQYSDSNPVLNVWELV